ncbi:sulfur carrier protein ThiS [bacterium]|nr:sulfur carrier protein ThiS [Candidatus Omnitrophota bacterium]MBU2527912.1 sulfur carrier protein ThiS [bacterium]MBU3929265.1 sulfur carrier protein ThiS [bacterium]MBU4123593.1 sulfur carrier protein ThiS [bacterium]
MKIRINGKDTAITGTLTLREFITGRNIDIKITVVEYNGKIVRKEDLGNIIMKAGDAIEIINFVGGG